MYIYLPEVFVITYTVALELLLALTPLASDTATTLKAYSSPGKRSVMLDFSVLFSTSIITRFGGTMARLLTVTVVEPIGLADTTKNENSGTPENIGPNHEK